MAPSLRRRTHRPRLGHPPPQPPAPGTPEDDAHQWDSASDESEEEAEEEWDGLPPGSGGNGDGEGAHEEEDEDEDEDEEGLEAPLVQPPDPIPPHLREISSLASWTVSSSKPGCSIPQLRSPNTNLFWQSDGPQPHFLNIHFFKLVRIVAMRLYLDFEADESYTPTRIVFLAGSGGNDLQEWGEMKLEQPRGWVWVDFEGVGEVSSDEEHEDGGDGREGQEAPFLSRFSHSSNLENHTVPSLGPSSPSPSAGATHPSTTATNTNAIIPRTPLAPLDPSPPRSSKPGKMPVLRAHLVQIKILENHQNGKDTHLRGLQIFARDNEQGGRKEAAVERGVRERSTGVAGLEKKTRKLDLREWDDFGMTIR